MPTLPEWRDEVVAVDPKFPSEELPKAADGGAAWSAGKSPEPTPCATPAR